jgi:hypothetical protein
VELLEDPPLISVPFKIHLYVYVPAGVIVEVRAVLLPLQTNALPEIVTAGTELTLTVTVAVAGAQIPGLFVVKVSSTEPLVILGV